MQELAELSAPPATGPPRAQHMAVFMLLLATVAWGFGFTWGKEAQSAVNLRGGLSADASFGPMFLLAARFLLGSLLLLILAPAARGGWSIASLNRSVVLGLLLGSGMILQHLGLARSTEAVTAFLTSLTILFVPLLAIVILRRPPRPVFWLAVIIATAGVWMMTGAAPSGFGIGEVLGTGCAIVFSFYILAVNALVPRDNVWRMTAGMFLVAGALCLVASAFVPGPATWAPIWHDPRIVMSFLLLLIFPTMFSYVVMNVYQPRIEATHAALIYLIEPIFASIYAWVARGAGLTTIAIIGAILILAANALVELLSKRR